MEQFDRAVRPLHERVVDFLARGHGTHGHRAVRQALGHRDQVRQHVETLRGKRGTEPAEAGNDLVENQQDAVLRAQLTQAFQVALGRDQHARRTGDGFDDHCCDIAGVVQRNEALEFIGEIRPVFGLAARERIPGGIVRVGQVIHARQHRAEKLAVIDHAAHGDAAETDAVITTFTADEASPRAFAAHPVIGERDFQGRIDRFRARVREKNVVDPRRQDFHERVGQFECCRVPHLEWRRVFHLRNLRADGCRDLLAAMPRIDAPEARHAVQDLPAIRGPVVHARGFRQQPRVGLELAIGRERHPEGFEIGTFGRAVGWHRRSLGKGEEAGDDKKN